MMTKVKAHCSAQDVVEGKTTWAHKFGNDRAETAADQEVKTHQAAEHGVAVLYHKRHQKHKAFMSRVQKYVVAIVTARKETLETLTPQQNPFNKVETGKEKHVVPVALEYRPGAEVERLGVRGFRPGECTDGEDQSRKTKVANFLAAL